jgi:uncharacterized Zn-binding protein involved in type VI secretion
MKTVGAFFLIVVAAFAALLILRTDAASVDVNVLAKEVELQAKHITELEKRVATLEGALKVSPGGVEIESAGTVTIRGAVLKLNGGGLAVARVGDRVSVTCPSGGGSGSGQITSGSSTVSSN